MLYSTMWTDLELSNSVSIKGLNVGSVYAIRATDKNIDGILVTISMKQDVNIPKNSVAVIESGIINSSNIMIQKGDAHRLYRRMVTPLATVDKGRYTFGSSAQPESGNEKS